MAFWAGNRILGEDLGKKSCGLREFFRGFRFKELRISSLVVVRFFVIQ
jgi:hypothetical protein